MPRSALKCKIRPAHHKLRAFDRLCSPQAMIVHLALESRMTRSVQRRLPGPLRHSSDLLLNLGGYSIRVFSQTSIDSGADSIQTTLTYKMEPNWQTCSFDIVNRTSRRKVARTCCRRAGASSSSFEVVGLLQQNGQSTGRQTAESLGKLWAREKASQED